MHRQIIERISVLRWCAKCDAMARKLSRGRYGSSRIAEMSSPDSHNIVARGEATGVRHDILAQTDVLSTGFGQGVSLGEMTSFRVHAVRWWHWW
jgi:hypothetical protein